MTRVLWLAVLLCVVQCLPMSQDELEDFSNFLLKTSSLDIHVKSAAPDDSYDEDEVVSDHAWEESGKFEGDLILNDRQRRLIVENVEGLSRNGLTDSTKRWPNNEVIYFIQKEHFTSGQVQAIQDGIDDLAQASCVKFRPYRKGDRDAVVIQGSRRGCFSQVGYQGGYQVLNLSGRHPVGRGCFRHGTVVHELLHSLGFYHMQSSPDRDDYINVVWPNIVQPARHNFRKYNSFSVSDFGVGYDYDSVLHYSRRAFSANGQDTLVPKKSGAQIGQRVGLSDKDTQKLNKMYCDADNDPAIQADENITKKPKNNKKKPKNQPFEGHGIGYHQGKTVVIKLPAAETYKLPNVPSTHVFDFSKTPQVVPPEAAGYRFGEEITYSYKPITLLNIDAIRDFNKPEVNPVVNKNIKQQPNTKEEGESLKENQDGQSSPQDSNEVKPEYVPIDDYDKDLKDAFDRLTKIVKQHIYPQNKGYDYKINKDYSEFFVPQQRQKSDPLNDPVLHDTFKQPISYEPSTKTPLKQIDTTQTSDDTFRDTQIQDRMDASFRTSLPNKNPYSSYEQTETPKYATLEYLKNRHDFSHLYSPEILDGNTQKDGNIATDGRNYKEDIKIDPYAQGFYTDYVNGDTKGSLTKDPPLENVSEKVKPSKYKQIVKPKYFQREVGIDSSYRTILPTKKPYSAYDQTETPRYATLEYLKERHDISNVYPPKNTEQQNKKETYKVSEDDHPPTEGDWYVKDSYKHNPADYDRDSYSDNVRQNPKNHDDSGKDKYTKYSLNKPSTNNKPEIFNQNFNSGYEKENEKLTTEGNFNDNKNKASSELEEPKYSGEHDYDYGKIQKEESYNFSPKDVYSEESPNLSHESLTYNQDYANDYERDTSSVEASKEEDNGRDSPKKSQAYTLYGIPVPLTKDWYKISYAIPEIPKANENTS